MFPAALLTLLCSVHLNLATGRDRSKALSTNLSNDLHGLMHNRTSQPGLPVLSLRFSFLDPLLLQHLEILLHHVPGRLLLKNIWVPLTQSQDNRVAAGLIIQSVAVSFNIVVVDLRRCFRVVKIDFKWSSEPGHETIADSADYDVLQGRVVQVSAMAKEVEASRPEGICSN